MHSYASHASAFANEGLLSFENLQVAKDRNFQFKNLQFVRKLRKFKVVRLGRKL